MRISTAASTLCLVLVFALAPTLARAQTLQETLTRVYQENPVLNAQRAQLRATNERYPQAVGAWLPTVELSGSYSRTANRQEAAADGTAVSYTQSEAVTLSQNLYQGGRNFAGLRKAKQDISSARERLRETEQTVLLDAITTYMDVLRDREIVAIRRNNVEVLRRHLAAIQVQFDLRRRTQADLAQARSRLFAAQAETAEAEARLTGSEERFERLAGAPPGTLTAPDAPEVPAPPETKPHEAVAANPTVRRQIFDLESARTDVEIAEGELLPRLSLEGSFTRSRAGTRNDTASGVDRSAVATLTLTVPIYQKGQTFSRIRASKYTAGQRRLDLDQAYRAAIEQLYASYDNHRAAAVKIQALEAQVEAAQVALASVQAELEVGRRSVLDLLDQEQEFLNARVNLISAERDRTVFAYTVARDLGRLNASDLALDVPLYDPASAFAEQRLKLFGTDVVPSPALQEE